jgi:uncharacterized protein with beta-barrel porin domain
MGGLAALPVTASACSPPVTTFNYYLSTSCSPEDSTLAASKTILDLGSRLLERMGNAATWGTAAAQQQNPGGGGAPQQTAPRFRAYGEAYGLSSRTDTQGVFAGDRRATFGGVAGFGYAVAPNFTVGLSIDQSHTAIDVPDAFMSARVDLTQFGVNGVYTHGPWTFVLAGVHGVGRINSSRISFGPNPAVASYNGSISGVLAEASRYWALGQQGRIVPKVAIEYAQSRTDGFTETGGIPNYTVSGTLTERARFLAGAEIGHYWIVSQKVVDVSAYAKLIDNFMQHGGALSVGGITIQGLRESTLGADVGGAVSVGLTPAARIYANYDGKLRTGFQSHSGTVGLELRW